MALSKLAPGIISITGKMAGNVFKRDASGQHTVSYPRVLHKPSTTEQKKQRAWYGEHKRHERIDPGPRIPDEPPKDPFTARVYSLIDTVTYKDPSVFKPPGAPEPDDPEIRAYAASIMSPYFLEHEQALKAIGLDLVFITELCYHYFWIARYTWGLITAECWPEAVQLTISFCEKSLLYAKLSIPVTWAAIIVAALIYSVYEFFAGHLGTLHFDRWNMMLRTSTNLYWAGLQAHPTKEMYTILQGPEVALPLYLSWYEEQRDYQYIVYFEPGHLFQFLTSSWAFWYTWTFGRIYLAIVGDAHPVAAGEWRMQGTEWSRYYLNMPLGAYYPPEQVLAYLNNFHNMFVPNT
jgi:hypothetical protein